MSPEKRAVLLLYALNEGSQDYDKHWRDFAISTLQQIGLAVDEVNIASPANNLRDLCLEGSYKAIVVDKDSTDIFERPFVEQLHALGTKVIYRGYNLTEEYQIAIRIGAEKFITINLDPTEIHKVV